MNPALVWSAADHLLWNTRRMPGLDEAIAHYWPKVERPGGFDWVRVEGGIDYRPPFTSHTWIQVHHDRVVRRYRGDPVEWATMDIGARAAWEALVGEPLPAKSEGVPDLAPTHHWSFVCTPERVDLARVYREMAAQGVDRNDVKIAIRPHGKKNLRVAVSSRGAQ